MPICGPTALWSSPSDALKIEYTLLIYDGRTAGGTAEPSKIVARGGTLAAPCIPHGVAAGRRGRCGVFKIVKRKFNFNYGLFAVELTINIYLCNAIITLCAPFARFRTCPNAANRRKALNINLKKLF